MSLTCTTPYPDFYWKTDDGSCVYPPPAADDSVGALVWVILTLYLVTLLGVAIYSFWRTGGFGGDSKVSKGRELHDHFVANRGLGAVVLTLTIFATIYSGYTVVGVPGEVFAKQFFGFRWLLTALPMLIPITMVGSRLNFLATVRDYISPTDFIKDRYKSRELAAFTTLIMAFPAVVYAMSQFKSMGQTVEALSDNKIESFHAAAVFCVVMVLYEIFGGLRAIAFTDALQGGILFFGFLFFFGAQWELFGGVEPAMKLMEYKLGLGAPGGLRLLDEEDLQAWFAFALSLFFSFPFYPHMIIRFQAAKNSKVVHLASLAQPIGTCVVMVSSLITGLIAYYWFPVCLGTTCGQPYTPSWLGELSSQTKTQMDHVFGMVVRRTIQENAFYNLLGSLMLAASVCAFMSTADSAIHATSACLTMDWAEPLVKKLVPTNVEKQEKYLLIFGKVSSFLIAIFALLSSEVDMSLSALLIVQGSVLMQVAPAFLLGFYNFPVKSFTVLLGQIVGIIFALYYQCREEDCLRSSVDPSWFGPIEGVHPAIFGLMVNFVICVIGMFLPNFIMWKIEGEDMPKEMLAFCAEGKRPWNAGVWMFVWWSASLLLCFTTPWWMGGVFDGDFLPADLLGPFGAAISQALGVQGIPAAVSKGLPTWIWKCGSFALVGVIFIMASIAFGWSKSDEWGAQAETSGNDSVFADAEKAFYEQHTIQKEAKDAQKKGELEMTEKVSNDTTSNPETTADTAPPERDVEARGARAAFI